MKAMIVADLDALARRSLEDGTLQNLSMDLHLQSQCHPTAGLRATRAYEGDTMMMTCAVCNLFVANVKIAQE